MTLMDNNWDFLISEFRRLGGIADNERQKEGDRTGWEEIRRG